MVAATQHDRFVDKDYERLQSFGIRTAREGIRWPLIESKPGRRDFSTVEHFLRAARSHGIQIIWDLFHFGWPDHLDIFSSQWLEAFVDLSYGFARILRVEGENPPFIAPVNEISFLAWAGGDVEYISPFQRGRGAELKEQLVRAAIEAGKAVRSVLPDAVIVSPEPVIHIVGDPKVPGDVEQAENYRRSMFEAWDMLLGRSHPELGGTENAIDVIGVNFYDRNEWWNFGPTIRRGDPEYRNFREILSEVYDRYRRPVFVAETGVEDDERPEWFRYILEEVQFAIDRGVPVEGLCWYPVTDYPGWDDDRHCFTGLWGYASGSGEREIYEPLAREMRRHSDLLSMKQCAPGNADCSCPGVRNVGEKTGFL